MIYILKRSQQLKIDLSTAWAFFSSPHNLQKITPKDMQFVVRSEDTGTAIFPGMIIDYTVAPLLGIPLAWRTKITDVDPQHSFTDFQLKGPYKLWKHKHEFIANKEGVLMVDTVEYELPFGLLGQFANRLFVEKKLKQIFEYRYAFLEQKFNK